VDFACRPRRFSRSRKLRLYDLVRETAKQTGTIDSDEEIRAAILGSILKSGLIHYIRATLNRFGRSRDRIAPWNICPLEPSKPRRFDYVAAQKERRRKHRTEATVGTEDVLPWVFCVFFGGQTRESPVLKAGLAT
jgi:hypothetical protein